MSRVGKIPVQLPSGTEFKINGRNITIKGSKGELNFVAPANVTVKQEDNQIVVSPNDDSKQAKSEWGTARSIIDNMVKGVAEGYTLKLELIGVGYRASVQGQMLSLSLGFSHDIKYALPASITARCPKQTEIELSGADKQLIGQIASEIRSIRPPEPYKGKGVRREGEYVRRKEGKKK